MKIIVFYVKIYNNEKKKGQNLQDFFLKSAVWQKTKDKKELHRQN